jgi:cytoskeletal protein CcmA (bactofilin family)
MREEGVMWKKGESEEGAPPQVAGGGAFMSENRPQQNVGVRESAVIGPSITIKGDVTGDENLVIQGRIEGTVTLKQHNVAVGPEGKVKASIHGRSVTVEGNVEGDLHGEEQVVLRASATVEGNIRAPRVTLEDGATFRGGIDMGEKQGASRKPEPRADLSPGAQKRSNDVIRLKGRAAPPVTAADDPDPTPTAPTEHGSPGLAKIFSSLHPEGDARILDLGPAVSSNIEKLSDYAGHIRVVDAAEALCAPIPDDDDWSPSPRVARLLPVEIGEFELVFVWDLLNYLRADVSDALVERLRHQCRPGTRLFALIHEGATMPARPQVYEVRGRDLLLYRPRTHAEVPGPSLPPAEVERRLEGFRIEASFVLRHGIREYVAIYV